LDDGTSAESATQRPVTVLSTLFDTGMNRAFSAGRLWGREIPGALPQAADEGRAFGAKKYLHIPLTLACPVCALL